MMYALQKTALSFMLCALLAAAFFTVPAHGAEENGSFWVAVGDSMSKAWTKGTFDFYLPVYTWHNRFMYSAKASKYNETPWGFGLGTSHFDSKGNQHALLAVGFMDSNNHFQPIVGYAHLWYWEMLKDLSAGVGIGGGFSARYEWSYIPFPGALPLVSLQYKSLAVLATYLPDAYNHGNVLFVMLRWHFN